MKRIWIVFGIALASLALAVACSSVGSEKSGAAAQPTATSAAAAGLAKPQVVTGKSPAELPTATPGLAIDVNKTYEAVIKTDKGDIRLQLRPDKAPVHVNNFVFLARSGYYDNITFHRVIEGFMAQSGDPSGTGTGSPGYTIPDEISDLTHDGPGILSMAMTAAPNSAGGQFFITYEATPWLDGVHTVFGKVIAGMDVLNSISPRDPASATAPGDRIRTIEIIEK